MGPATRSKLTRLAVLFGEHGLGDKARRADRLRLCSDHAGRYLTSSAQLSDVEASTLIERLDRLPRDGSLTRAAARLVIEEERAAAMHAGKVGPGVIACGRGSEPTERDLATVAAFATALEQGPAAVRDFALAEPEQLAMDVER